MTIADIVRDRGIESILHFTTNRGSLGVFASRALKSRHRLNGNEELKHIFQPNASNRDKDRAWLDYVNLSISRINTKFFNVSSGGWHGEKNLWWCILSFHSEILSHPGVYFATTNNIYSGVKRGNTSDALEAAFAPSVLQWIGSTVNRDQSLLPCQTTCMQAEVLYPGELSTDFLKEIFVETDECADELAAQISIANHPNVRIIVDRQKFSDIK